MVKPKNWRQIQNIRWNVYAEFKDIIEDFFATLMVVELDVRQDKLIHLKERLLDRLKKATEIYHA